jgi:hypothetical protein
MKINKLKKSTLKNDKIFLGSYHRAIKKSSFIFKAFLLYHAKVIKREIEKVKKPSKIVGDLGAPPPSVPYFF